MAVYLDTVMNQLVSFLQASGRVETAAIDEPLDPPAGVHAAVMLSQDDPLDVTLTKLSLRRTVIVRIYIKAMQRGPMATDLKMDRIVMDLIEDFCGKFRLNDDNNVRAFMPAYMSVRYGYQSIGNQGGAGGVMYRMADISLPIDVNDVATFAA